jgi:hypothetical protein
MMILHFGDHDPSGIDMSRDIEDRLKVFMGGVEFKRLALNMDQVTQYSPPPNPTKMTDSRAENNAGTGYADVYGDECWELDALNPTILSDLVRDEVESLIDQTKWDAKVDEENEHRRLLGVVSENWDKLTRSL